MADSKICTGKGCDPEILRCAEKLDWPSEGVSVETFNMSNPVRIAVETYIRAVCRSDREARVALFEACLADDVRMVTRSREIRGRAKLTEELNQFLSDPQLLRVRVASAVDAEGTTFRFRAVADFSNGTSAEAFDAGQIDEDGRIVLILTFSGPLSETVDESIA